MFNSHDDDTGENNDSQDKLHGVAGTEGMYRLTYFGVVFIVWDLLKL